RVVHVLDVPAGVRGGAGERGRVVDCKRGRPARLGEGRRERRRLLSDDHGLRRAGAGGVGVVGVARVLGQPVVGAGLGGGVATALGAVGAAVGAVARDRDTGRLVDGGGQAGAVIAGGEEVEADRGAGARGRPAERGGVGQ